MSSDHLYVVHRALIEQVISIVCRSQRLNAADAEDFAGAARIHLIDDNCAVLRKFDGRSGLKTYLAVVVAHLYQDWRDARWGKWRPSAQARRGGPVGLLLERLIVRDKLTFDEAYETLRTNYQTTDSRDVLEALAARFPRRTSRRFVSEETLDGYVARTRGPDALLEDEELDKAGHAALAALTSVLAQLEPQDRLILRMRFEDNFPIVAIARALQLDQKQLYRRIERLLANLRARLEASGISVESITALFDREGLVLPDDQTIAQEIVGQVRLLKHGDRSGAGTVRKS